jgi:hypothetical protein
LTETSATRNLVKLRQIRSLGPFRSALAVALIQNSNRFRTKSQLWTLQWTRVRDSRQGRISARSRSTARRRKKQVFLRRLNKDYNHDLKACLKPRRCGPAVALWGGVFAQVSRMTRWSAARVGVGPANLFSGKNRANLCYQPGHAGNLRHLGH